MASDKLMNHTQGETIITKLTAIADSLDDLAAISPAKLGMGIATCDTPASTAAKTAALANFALVEGAPVSVQFLYANTADNATLNINNTGAKPIIYKDAAIGNDVISAGDTCTFIYTTNTYKITNIDTLTGPGSGTVRQVGAENGLITDQNDNADIQTTGKIGLNLKSDTAFSTEVSAHNTSTDNMYPVALDSEGHPVAAVSNFVGSGSNHKAGLVPDTPSTAGTTKYLREDATWVEPTGDDLKLTGYEIGSQAAAVAATDTINEGIGKLEYKVDANNADIQSILDGTTIDSFSDVETALSGKQATLSTAQLAAVNSGIDTTKVGQIATNTSDISSLQDAVDTKLDKTANAASAAKLNNGTTDYSVGSATKGVYFNNGVPTAMTYSVNSNVPENAVFTDTTYSSGSGITVNSSHQINHSNSVSEKTTASALKVAYDAQGHITGSSALTASDVGAIATTAKGVANGVAELDSTGKVPSSQLPSYVDDVLEYSAKSSFPATGESGKIYVDTSTNKTYRWSGTTYVEISESLALGDTSSTAYYGDKGKTAYEHSQVTSGNPHNVTKTDVGLGNVGNFKAVSTVASQGLSDTEKLNARANIGAGTSSFSGSYNDLSNKPTLGSAASKDVPSTGDASDTQVVMGNDSRLTDARTPTSHNHTKSQITDFPTSMTPTSHTHGNIQNGGTLQTNDITIARGDKLVVTDSSDSSKIARASISFDGSTTTKALTQKGTWETFNNYSHPTTSGNKHIPSGGSSGQILRWSADGTATWGSDNNTTYTVATGDANGQIKITPSVGNAYNVSVKGLGSAAYTASTAYAASSHNHDAGNITSGTLANARFPARLQEYDSTNRSIDTTAQGVYYINGYGDNPFKMYNSSSTDFLVFALGYSLAWGFQIATDFRTNSMAIRNKNNGTWNSWAKVNTRGLYDSTPDKVKVTGNKGKSKCTPKMTRAGWFYPDTRFKGTESGIKGERIWTDGDCIYYSNGPTQLVLYKFTKYWQPKTWTGLTKFSGNYVWTDGDNIYYSSGTDQYVLNKSTSTWSTKTWYGLTSFSGINIWTDGDNIYYSNESNSDQYVLNKSTSTWSTKTWSGLTPSFGSYVWTDGDNIYYSGETSQYVLNKSTSTWSTKTWSGLTNFRGDKIWTDGDNIYYSSGSTQCVLNKSTSTWSTKTWHGLSNLYGYSIWTDGDNIYYAIGPDIYVLDQP